MRIEALGAEAARLGECPIWCERSNRLWWVDVLTPALWSFAPASGECRRHDVRARRIGSLALREQGGLVLACDDGLYAYNPDTTEQTFLIDPEPGMADHRKNDGRVDPDGNFWIGTLRETDYAPVGSIYRVAPDLTVTKQADGLAIPNSLAFDAGRGRMYFADTRAFAIWACDYDAKGGLERARTNFAETTAPARPDGSCVDAQGCLWNAEYAGGRVVRYAPNGEPVGALNLPVTYPTCCCFGGPGLDRLYITSACEPLSASEREAEPLAGRVLVVESGVRGRPEYRAAF
ncbi:MAG TPA: SMP-30/gluconolactonase/LRE family protein [Pseudolabrys sp.]|nr:SMP-30/gluconolactonase/LRE family protein [Pseudolabrys sp.]